MSLAVHIRYRVGTHEVLGVWRGTSSEIANLNRVLPPKVEETTNRGKKIFRIKSWTEMSQSLFCEEV